MHRLEEVSYEELADLTELRQSVIDKLAVEIDKSPLNPEQKQRIHQLIKGDQLILSRMEDLKQEASQWLIQRDLAKTRRNAYEAAYAYDSMLMDQRK